MLCDRFHRHIFFFNASPCHQLTKLKKIQISNIIFIYLPVKSQNDNFSQTERTFVQKLI